MKINLAENKVKFDVKDNIIIILFVVLLCGCLGIQEGSL